MAAKAKCKHCGHALSKDRSDRATCVNKDCVMNKKTKLICQKCQAVMEDRCEGDHTLHRCPNCGITVRSA